MTERNNRPKVICHMMTSLDGKIQGSFLKTSPVVVANEEYERIGNTYNANGWLCGSATIEQNFTNYRKPELNLNAPAVEPGDYISKSNTNAYFVSIDRSGKIGWTANTVKYMQRPEAHIIEVLSEQVSNDYLDLLRRLDISYIFAGKDNIDFTVVLTKLKALFEIETLMVSGGTFINTTFLAENLLDELSIVMVSLTDASSDTLTLFETGKNIQKIDPAEFTLFAAEKIKGNALWLRYDTINS